MRALVTGGGGFLGLAIVRRLRERGYDVRSLTRGHYEALDALGVDARRGDLSDPKVVLDATDGCDAVFHVAAKAGVWGPYESYHQTNVVGTENVIAACRAHGVSRLVYTSTPSVVHSGADVEGVDESAPYADHYETAYPKTKAEAERAVLGANGADLSTVALRPHLIWGPGDNHLVPRILDRKRRGKLRIVGPGDRLIDGTYIDNAADAHLDALDRLAPDAACAGRAYFITNDEPIATKDLINRICVAGGLEPCERHIPAGVAWTAGAVLEFVYRVLGRDDEPMMTRFVARQLSTAHWYDISAAKRDLGYVPKVTIDEGMDRLARSLR